MPGSTVARVMPLDAPSANSHAARSASVFERAYSLRPFSAGSVHLVSSVWTGSPRAAKRLALSQPALTRALQRLRQTFNDDLFIRVSGNYEPTPKGTRLLRELETMLPRLDRLLAGPTFDPATEEAKFYLAGTDYAAHVICPPLCRQFLASGKRVSFDLTPLNDHVFDSMEGGRLDLLLHADDGHVPTQYPRETIFEEEFVCVVAKDSPYSGGLTTKQYLNGRHVGVTIFGGKQTIPEQRLRAAGMQRHCAFHVPFFSVATLSNSSTSPLAMGESGMTPAQCTTTSREPNSPRVREKCCVISPASDMSALIVTARPPAEMISRAASSAFAALPV